MDETYVKVKGEWKYLYRAIDEQGNTLDFYLSHRRNTKAAKRFLKKLINHHPVCDVRTINTDKSPTYPQAIAELKQEGLLSKDVLHTQIKYRNNRLESDPQTLDSSGARVSIDEDSICHDSRIRSDAHV